MASEIRRKAEAVMHGMTNSWGADYTSTGEMFVINTVIGHLWHALAKKCRGHSIAEQEAELMANVGLQRAR